MTILTPPVEDDLVARLVALTGATPSLGFTAANVRAGEEIIHGGDVPRVCAFVRSAGERADLHNDGQTRWLVMQILDRFDPQPSPAAARARGLVADRLYDVLHTTTWVGASGTRYMDTLYIDKPRLLTNAYYVHNLELLVGA